MLSGRAATIAAGALVGVGAQLVVWSRAAPGGAEVAVAAMALLAAGLGVWRLSIGVVIGGIIVSAPFLVTTPQPEAVVWMVVAGLLAACGVDARLGFGATLLYLLAAAVYETAGREAGSIGLAAGALCVAAGLAVRRFAATIAHQRRELARIEETTRQRLVQQLHDETARRLARHVLEVRAMSHEAEGTLQEDLGRLEQELRITVERTRDIMDGIDAVPALRTTLGWIPPRWGAARQLELRVDWRGGPVRAECVPAMRELLANAEKYAQPGTTVTLSARGGAVTVSNVIAEDADSGLRGGRGLSFVRQSVEEVGGQVVTETHGGVWIAEVRGVLDEETGFGR